MKILGYQVFTNKLEANIRWDANNVLRGFPRGKTLEHTPLLENKDENKWALAVTQILIDACSEMNTEQKLVHYDDTDLKNLEYLESNNFEGL